MEEIIAKNNQIESEKEKLQMELAKRKEVEDRWRIRCGELEKEIEKLKKENEDFYNADKFGGF